MAINGVSGAAQQQQAMQKVNSIAQDMEQVKAAPQDPMQVKSEQQTEQVNATRTDSDGDNDGSKGYSKDPGPSSSSPTLTPPWVGRNIDFSG